MPLLETFSDGWHCFVFTVYIDSCVKIYFTVCRRVIGLAGSHGDVNRVQYNTV